jgi:hypothetical protein
MIKGLIEKRIHPLIGIAIILFFLFTSLILTHFQWIKIESDVMSFSQVELAEKKKEEGLEASELIPLGFSEEKKEELFEDINGDGKKEILVTSVNDENVGFLVVAIINENNKFEKIGEFRYEGAYRGPLSVMEVKDINNNGKKEIILSLASGGVSTSAYGILSVDFYNKKIDWMKIRGRLGEEKEALFYVGSALTHYHSYKIEDLDNDNQEEIITINSWLEKEKPAELEEWEVLLSEEDAFGDTWWRCEIAIYKWNGDKFSYNQALLNRIGESGLRKICTSF